MRQIALFLLLFFLQLFYAKVINVPADQGTIQAGIYAGSTGDENYISQTKIDGSDQTVFVISAPADVSTSIIGLTIQNGEYGVSASAHFQIRNSIINCSYGIDYESGGGRICRDNVFRNNIRGNGTDTENCNLDPATILFNDPGFVNGYDMSDASPCRDAGTSAFVWKSDTVSNLSPGEYVGTNPDSVKRCN